MRIELDPNQSLGQCTLRLTHKNDTLLWDVSAYYQRSGERSVALDDNMVFDEINAYWASLPNEKRDAIWQIYKEARDTLDTHYDIAALRKPLVGLVKRLYDIMQFDAVEQWLHFQGVRLPTTLKEQYDPRDIPEQTYLKNDYMGLVTLAVILRPMLPIWGEFIGLTHKEAGNAFKEYQALKLLHDASVMLTQPMERLKAYIQAFVDRAFQPGLSSSALLNGLSSSELLNYILGLTVVRRLTVGQINARDDNSSLISNVHQYIQNNLKSLDRKVGVQKFGGNGRVVDKRGPEDSPDDNKASVVELYKIKQETADGELVFLSIHTEEVASMVAAIDPTIPPEYLQLCLDAVGSIETAGMEPHQYALVQYVTDAVIPAQGINELPKPSLLRAFAVTQAALWHWQFYDLAALVTATPLPVHEDEIKAFTEGRARIPKELMEEARVRWPYYRDKRGKQSTERVLNVAAKAVDKFSSLVTANDWHLNCPQTLLLLTSRFPNSRRLTTPQDIRAHVMRLLLKVTA